MEEYLRLGLLSIAAFILFLIILDSWLRRRRLKMARVAALGGASSYNRHIEPTASLDECAFSMPATHEPVFGQVKQPIADLADDVIVLSVFSKPNSTFNSYDLLQAISSTGMQYGDMNIFHYFTPTDQDKKVLFSLASATKPGTFDLDRIGDLSCMGLTLFMDLHEVPEPEQAFKIMLRTAEQLAEDLDGELRGGLRTAWNDELLEQYLEKVKYFKSSSF